MFHLFALAKRGNFFGSYKGTLLICSDEGRTVSRCVFPFHDVFHTLKRKDTRQMNLGFSLTAGNFPLSSLRYERRKDFLCSTHFAM